VRLVGNGVLDMTLASGSYSWQFIRSTGGAGTVADMGSTSCA
jgi:hypothetical protein